MPQSTGRAGKDLRDIRSRFALPLYLCHYLRPAGLHCREAADHCLTTKDKPSKNSKAATKKRWDDPALPSAHHRVRKEAAQGSSQLQLYKVMHIFYLETVKPILVSSIFKNNPVVSAAIYLTNKEESEKNKAAPKKNRANCLH